MTNIHAHIDRLVGRATRAAQRRQPPARHTVPWLDALRGRPVEELFPPPSGQARCDVPGHQRVGPLRTRTLRFESEHEPLVPEMRDLYHREAQALHIFRARELRLGRAPRRRALIYVHGWMEMNEEVSDVLLAPVLARTLGADVFSLKLPHHWSRQLAGSSVNGILYCSADLARTAEAFRQSVMDARTLFEHLVQRGVYDEIGMLGISLGGIISTLSATAESRLAFVAPLISHLDLADLMHHAEILVEVRLELERHGIRGGQIEELMEAIGFLGLEPAIEGRRILPIAARDDQFMRAEAVQRHFGRWPGVEVQWVPGGHITSLFGIPWILPRLRQRIDALAC